MSSSPRGDTRPTRFPRRSACLVVPVPSPVGGFFNYLAESSHAVQIFPRRPRSRPRPRLGVWARLRRRGRRRGRFGFAQRLGSLCVLRPAGVVSSLTLARPPSSLRAMSKLPFELMLALRYLRPRRTFVSVITLISIIGVMLGVAVLIIVISVMSGFDRHMRDKILGFNAHIRVVHAVPMPDYRQVMSVIASNQNVKGVAPYVIGQVLVKTEPESGNPQVLAPMIRGIDARLVEKVSALPSSVVEGKFDVTGKGLLAGKSIAERLNLAVGDHVAVYSVRTFEEFEEGRKKGKEEAPLADDYEVKGIFDVGYYEFNDL